VETASGNQVKFSQFDLKFTYPRILGMIAHGMKICAGDAHTRKFKAIQQSRCRMFLNHAKVMASGNDVSFAMNNNLPALFRSLIVYALCIPLAIWMGYLVALPLDRSSLSIWGIVALLLCTPILLRHHHLLLIAAWNFPMAVFFLPGGPSLMLPMVCLSLGISVLYRTLNSEARFISAPQITWPLLVLTAVVVFTAELTGGFGMKSLGSDVFGGKRYVYLLLSIFGYFALTAKSIPKKRATLYVGLFFLSACSSVIGDLAGQLPSQFNFIFAFFSPSAYGSDNGDVGSQAIHIRFGGLGVAGTAFFFFMMARYGVRGIFVSGKPWRILVFILFSVPMCFSGFRNIIIQCGIIFVIQFFMEGLHRTKVFPFFIFTGLFIAALIVPLANKLPYEFQRSLAFLPLNINPEAKLEAQGTQEWRLQMWEAVLPQVPGYLLLGKGYAISQIDYQTMTSSSSTTGVSAADWGAAIAGNYHSGPLSVVVFFGIWGVIAIIWFWAASLHALFCNYRYSDPALQTFNRFLFVFFIVKILIFLIVFGALHSDMAQFVGIIGLSVSLNGGIHKAARKPVQAMTQPKTHAPRQPRFQPFYQR
jgi:uncharacterized protein (DUF983 family)